MTNDYMTMTQAQAYLCVARQTIYRLAWRGDLPTVKIGGKRLVPVAELRKRLERSNIDK